MLNPNQTGYVKIHYYREVLRQLIFLGLVLGKRWRSSAPHPRGSFDMKVIIETLFIKKGTLFIVKVIEFFFLSFDLFSFKSFQFCNKTQTHVLCTTCKMVFNASDISTHVFDNYVSEKNGILTDMVLSIRLNS